MNVSRRFEHLLSESDEVNGTEPVRRTINIPTVSNAMPKDLAKYSSRAMGLVSTDRMKDEFEY